MYFIFILFILLSGRSYNQAEHIDDKLIKYLEVDIQHVEDGLTLLQSIYSQNLVHIYCRRDEPLRLGSIFQSNQLRLVTKERNVEYRQYRDSTADGVLRAHLENRELKEDQLLPSYRQVHHIALPAYAHSCYGIFTDQAYNVTLLQFRNDDTRVAAFLLGLAMWTTAKMFGEYLICCYALTFMLGVSLSGLVAVCFALIMSGDYQLRGLHPISGNIALLVEHFPTTMAIFLVTGAWLLLRICQRNSDLWRHYFVRDMHRRVLRLISYILIGGASEHVGFSRCCICLLFPFPELWWLLQFMCIYAIKTKRTYFPPSFRHLLNEAQFEAQTRFETEHAVFELRQRLQNDTPTWQQLSSLHSAQQVAHFISGANHVQQFTTINRQVQTVTDDAAATFMQRLTDLMGGNINNPNISNTSTASNTSVASEISRTSTESVYQNLHYPGPSRSLRDDYADFD